MRESTLIPPPGVEVINYSQGPLWIDPSGVVVTVNNGMQTHGLAEARISAEIIRKVSGNTRYPLLVDFSKVKSMTREAREFYASEECAGRITALAILTNSLVGKMVANFFLGLSKAELPTRLFNESEEAFKWLKSYPAIKEEMPIDHA